MIKDSTNEWAFMTSCSTRRQEVIQRNNIHPDTPIPQLLKSNKQLMVEIENTIQDYIPTREICMGTVIALIDGHGDYIPNRSFTLMRELKLAVNNLKTLEVQSMKLYQSPHTSPVYRDVRRISNDIVKWLKLFDSVWLSLTSVHRRNIRLLERINDNY